MGAIRQSLHRARSLRPGKVRQEMGRPFWLELVGADEEDRAALARVFIPENIPAPQRSSAVQALSARSGPCIRVRTPRAFGAGTIVDPAEPRAGLIHLLRDQPGHRLALARVFPPLRELLAQELIRAVASRNATVAAVSALPEVIPTPLSLIMALGEMGSDTVIITANQVGLCFHLAALRGERVGWRAQSGRIGTVIVAGLGWRTLARELVGLIPAGVGLAAKAGIAYSGTLAVGAALWRTPRVAKPSLVRQFRTRAPQPPTLATERQSA